MNAIIKVLSIILGSMAVAAFLAVVGLIAYSLIFPEAGTAALTSVNEGQNTSANNPIVSPAEDAQDLAGLAASLTDTVSSPVPSDHIHDYKETVDQLATCLSGGRLKFTCVCGTYYYTETHAIGHVADDWEIETAATASKSGLRVKHCIYCDEIIASEVIPATDSGTGGTSHTHQYVAAIVSEPTCTVAGITRFTCSCGSFYTQSIPANGHLPADWTEIKAATTSETGIRQRICNVCKNALDSREIPKLAPSPTPSSSGSPTPTPSATPTVSPTPSPTPHTHTFTSYVYKAATCTEKGILTSNCPCGADKYEEIPLDSKNHMFVITVIPATDTQKGYTKYVCSRCNYSYTE